MSVNLETYQIPDFESISGIKQDVHLTYRIYGCALHSAPIILVNHALTGNSDLESWWFEMVGPDKPLDTNRFTLLTIDLPGNGHDRDVDHLVYNYKDWNLGDVARAFVRLFEHLGIRQFHLGIGGSIGGALLWELLAIEPSLFKTIVPIAADWKATDWLIACCYVQEQILSTSSAPLETARKHAMTFYRSPQSLKHKFQRAQVNDQFKVNAWLDHHGKILKSRFTLPAYRLVNHLLQSTDAARSHKSIDEVVGNTETQVHLVAIDSDGFFVPQEDRDTHQRFRDTGKVHYYEIKSLHGHDAFLIEHDQVSHIINQILATVVVENPVV
ncbi:alpha/beta fold hydrolase [Nonlabens ponticola]|uniref:Alpha/beta fold hydrolase n=1 Tax=Nonlabens ponticola TaxID=2496866 RepID=A0A3S9MWH1_9FLAO|nr:alpha/beta fold hydrolase [Nonlabens ponticola]AZQ43548.1 alpha/beta fold hydrolase [Nonlabens ponticola]